MYLFNKLPLKVKFGLIPLLFLLLFITSIVLIFKSRQEERYDTEIVNIAGRQRMLSQKIAFVSELIIRGEDSLKDDLTELLKLCDQSLVILENGGVAPGFSDLEIPPSPLHVQEELEQAKQSWVAFKTHAESLIKGNREEITYLESHAEGVLKAFNDLTQAYVILNQAKKENQHRTLWILLALNVIIAIATIYLVHKHLTVPILKISSRLKGLAKGQLTKKIDYDSKDELGSAVQDLNNLIVAIRKISDFSMDISEGKLNSDYSLLSEEDRLGKSLIQMKNRIHQIVSETNFVINEVAQNGNFSSMISLHDKEGAWKDLGLAINTMLEEVSGPLTHIKQLFGDLSSGDLSVKYQGNLGGEIEELTENFNNAVERLSDLIRSLTDNSARMESTTFSLLSTGEEITLTTSEISGSIDEISRGSQLQMKEIDETSFLIESMSSSFKETSSNTTKINNLAKTNKELSEKGKQEMSRILSLNEQVSGAFKQSAILIENLVTRSNQINEILKVINDITSQTNLLALNASIEAAHAGDQGRGFAVVADEIRKLAMDSKRSSHEIETLITTIRKDIEDAMQSMDETNRKIVSSIEAGNSANGVINDISNSAEKTHNLSAEITVIVDDQRAKIKEMVSKSTSVASISEETAAGTEQVASSSREMSAAMDQYMIQFRELNEIAIKLKERANQFKLKETVEIELNEVSEIEEEEISETEENENMDDLSLVSEVD